MAKKNIFFFGSDTGVGEIMGICALAPFSDDVLRVLR